MQPTVTTRQPADRRPLDLPLIGSSYPHVLRSPRHRWWNPVVSWLVAVLLVPAVLFGTMLGYLVFLLATKGEDAVMATGLEDLSDPPAMLALNLILALLIGVALLAVAVGHPVASRYLHSVEGRVRWGWLARCMLVLLPLWVVVVGISWVLDGSRNLGLAEGWAGLLAVTLLTTPLQSAGEEYLFRGFVITSLGSWFARPAVGLAVAVVVSSALFAAAHGSADPWIVVDLVGMSVACVFLSWRTGGLEAAVAIHVVNNIVVGILGIVTGTVDEGYIDASTQGSPEQTLMSLGVTGVATALLVWQARRANVARVVPEGAGALP